MIARYTRPDMGRIWSEENKYKQWLEVELAASEALAGLGVVPEEAARDLRKHASFSVDRIQEIENTVRHDVIAFTTAVNHLEFKLDEIPGGTGLTCRHRAIGFLDPSHREGVGQGWRNMMDAIARDFPDKTTTKT